MTNTRRLALVGGVVVVLLLATAAMTANNDKPAADEKAARQKSKDNLKQLALAMHNYANMYGHLPPAALNDKKGKPLLSWRVAILPTIGEGKLYKEFRLDEPWDSARNKKLLAKMPKLYASVLGKPKQPHSTYYQVFTGDGGFGGDTPGIFPAKFIDGTSNTILIIEAGDAVPWTKPVDLDYQPKMAIPKLGGLFKDGYHAALADGSVFFIKRKKIKEDTLRAAITPAGGEVLGDDWDKAREP